MITVNETPVGVPVTVEIGQLPGTPLHQVHPVQTGNCRLDVRRYLSFFSLASTTPVYIFASCCEMSLFFCACESQSITVW